MQNINDQKLYTAPHTKCPLCESKQITQLYKIDRYELPFKVGQCQTCNFIFTNPRFIDEIITSFYSKDYFSGNADYSYHDERDIKKYSKYVWEKRINVLNNYIDEGNFLDIGASFGGLMEAAGKYYNPYGIELSEHAGKHAQNLTGCKVHIGTLEDHPFQEDFFSAITMIEVIEHLKDPVSAIKECQRLLKKDGILMIQTANMNGMQAKSQKNAYPYYMPGHLSYFTKKNLTDFLLKNGFRKVKIFHPVEFGLLPKLQKSRGSFKSLLDYRHWFRISYYHYLSKIHFGNFSATSSMVVYAFK